MADDVGEALDFVVGALKIRGPFPDGAFKVGVQDMKLLAAGDQGPGKATDQPEGEPGHCCEHDAGKDQQPLELLLRAFQRTGAEAKQFFFDGGNRRSLRPDRPQCRE